MTPEKEQLIRSCLRYEDGHLYWKVDRNGGAKKGDVVGRPRKDGYEKVQIGGSTLYTHRVIFFLHHGYWPTVLDHINRDRTDNRIDNLRESDYTRNSYNASAKSGNKFGRNITWSKQKGKYHVSLEWKGKKTHCGYFDSLEEAREAANFAREKYHGEYAYKETTQ